MIDYSYNKLFIKSFNLPLDTSTPMHLSLCTLNIGIWNQGKNDILDDVVGCHW